jgi:glutamate-5-semialdehyde dehydrogenase
MIETAPQTQMRELAERARAASVGLRTASAEQKTRAIRAMARGLLAQRERLLEANARDVAAAEANGLGSAKTDRLRLNESRLAEMARALDEVAALPDPVGMVIDDRVVGSGMRVQRVRVPLGVVLFIYESRPNVTSDAASICLKASDAVILRGGSEARESNAAIVAVLQEALVGEGLPADAIQTVPTTDRAAVNELLGLSDLIDLVIPRGGESLIRTVAEHSRIPVLKHFVGNCHVYVDAAADLDMAERIVVNAKVQRPSVCNAAETVLVHQAVAAELLPRLARAMPQVELRGDAASRRILPELAPAAESDWYEEYLDLVLAVKVVAGLDEAIEHVSRYGSAHSDAIVTDDEAAARRFIQEVDSSSVLWNASTRMADGGCYGLGAEIGISTDKLHARGPMGVEELTTYKWVVLGTGQLRS